MSRARRAMPVAPPRVVSPRMACWRRGPRTGRRPGSATLATALGGGGGGRRGGLRPERVFPRGGLRGLMVSGAEPGQDGPGRGEEEAAAGRRDPAAGGGERGGGPVREQAGGGALGSGLADEQVVAEPLGR